MPEVEATDEFFAYFFRVSEIDYTCSSTSPYMNIVREEKKQRYIRNESV